MSSRRGDIKATEAVMPSGGGDTEVVVPGENDDSANDEVGSNVDDFGLSELLGKLKLAKQQEKDPLKVLVNGANALGDRDVLVFQKGLDDFETAGQVVELYNKQPDENNSLTWCLDSKKCELRLRFNYEEFAEELKKPEPQWPQTVWDKVKASELIPASGKEKYFQEPNIPPDVVELLRMYPYCRKKLEKSSVFVKWLLTLLPHLEMHEGDGSWSQWVTSGLKWVVAKGLRAGLWLLHQNPILVACAILLSKCTRFLLCIYMAKLTRAEVQTMLTHLFNTKVKENPIIQVISWFLTCAWNVVKAIFDWNLQPHVGFNSIVNALETCLPGGLQGVVRWLASFLKSVLQYLVDKLVKVPVVGEYVKSFVEVVIALSNCIEDMRTCIGEVWKTLKQGTRNIFYFTMLFLLHKYRKLENLLCYVTSGLCGVVKKLAGTPVSLAMYLAYAAGQGGLYMNNITGFIDELRGWLDILMGCGLTRMINWLLQYVKVGGGGQLFPESQISCCMANVLQELYDAAHPSFYNRVTAVGAQMVQAVGAGVDAAKRVGAAVWDYAKLALPCDARHKVLVFRDPVGTVQVGRKKVQFFAFVWKRNAPYNCGDGVRSLHVAPVAQKLQRQFPDAVRSHPLGYGLVVNLSALPVAVRKFCWYVNCPVISLGAGECVRTVRELYGQNGLFVAH